MIYCCSGSDFGKVSVLVPFLKRQKVEVPAIQVPVSTTML
jgi:hypothetical protein